MDTRLVTTFLTNFASEIAVLKKSNHLSRAWFLDGDWNRQSWLHGRVWAAMVRAVPRKYVPNIEISLPTPDGPQGSYKPDLLVCDTENRPKLMVDLESSNTSDLRVVERNLPRIRSMANAPETDRPEIALIMTIMPSAPIANVPFYGKPSLEARELRQKNPYAYHRDLYLKALREFTRSNLGISIAWGNLDVHGVYLEYWDGRGDQRPYWPTE